MRRQAIARVRFRTTDTGLIVLAASLRPESRGISAADAGAGTGSVLSLAALAMLLLVMLCTSGTMPA